MIVVIEHNDRAQLVCLSDKSYLVRAYGEIVMRGGFSECYDEWDSITTIF